MSYLQLIIDNNPLQSISIIVTTLVGVIGALINWNSTIKNRNKEINQKEHQLLLENLKGFWENQNRLYSETLNIVSVLVFNDDTKSEEFLTSYERFWKLYWAELPTCESKEVESAMADLGISIHKKKHDHNEDLNNLKKQMKLELLNLATAVRESSLLLEYSESIKEKLRKQ